MCHAHGALHDLLPAGVVVALGDPRGVLHDREADRAMQCRREVIEGIDAFPLPLLFG